MAECDPAPANPAEVEGLYPDSSSPAVRIDKLSALCSFGMTPLVMTGAIRQIFCQYFADTRNIRNPRLRDFLAREGAYQEGEDRGLYIESLALWKPELMQARPAIIVKEGDYDWRRVGIGDQMGADYRSGEKFFGGFWWGTHTIFAIGNETAETQILAIEIAKLMLHFGPLIMDQLELHRFLIMKIGAIAALQESTENYVVPIPVAIVYHEGWSLQEEAPRLKRIVFDTDTLIR